MTCYISVTENILLDFGRTPQWNCPIPESDAALASTDEQPHDEEGPAALSLPAAAPKDNTVNKPSRHKLLKPAKM